MARTVTKEQKQRLVEALKRGPISIKSARESLNIPCPAARVHELRSDGFTIGTVMNGRDALYFLVKQVMA